MLRDSLDSVLQCPNVSVSIFPGDEVFPGGVAGNVTGPYASLQIAPGRHKILFAEIGDIVFREPEFTLQQGQQPLLNQLIGWTVECFR